MRRLKNILFVFLLFVFPISVNAQDLQEAPSLQIGLSKVSFTKGNLDPELIAEIVAEKQKEVKVKLIKNMLLKNLGVDNGLFYAFIDHNIDILTTEKDEDTRVKNLLENAVNLAFVVSYAEYYVSMLDSNSAEWNSLKNLAYSYGIDTTLFLQRSLSLKDFAKIKFRPLDGVSDRITEDKKEKQRNQFVGVIIDLFAEQIRQNEQLRSIGLLRTNYLQNYISMNAYASLKNENTDTAISNKMKRLEHLLTNALYASKRKTIEDQILPQLKLGNEFVLDSATLAGLNQYRDGIKTYLSELQKAVNESSKQQEISGYWYNENYRFLKGTDDFSEFMLHKYEIDVPKIYKTKNKKLINEYSMLQWYYDAQLKLQALKMILNKRDQADEIYKQVGVHLNVHLKYYGLIKTLSSKGTDWEKALQTISRNFSCSDAKGIADSMLQQFQRARGEIKNLAAISAEEINDLEQISSFLDKLRFAELNRYEYMEKYEKEIKPSLTRLSKYSFDFFRMNQSMFDMLTCISSGVKDDLAKIHIDINGSFINIFTKIDEFDKIQTYSDFLNQLGDAGDIFGDEQMRKSVNSILTIIKTYIKPGKDKADKPVISLDIEGLLLSIQKMPYNKFRPLQFHFTVGVNNAAFQKPFVLNGNDTLRNYSFVGEKIGVKFKIFDFKYVRSFGKGETFTYWRPWKWWFPFPVKATYVRNVPPKEPAISNIHILAYGSGLLYNIVNTGTTKDFNNPLIAAGLGFTFFNDLDLNVSWGKPIVKNKSFSDGSVPSYFNLGFDVQFVEYYNRLNQKRKANQTQKKIVAAKAVS